jgi:hypothetical protein
MSVKPEPDGPGGGPPPPPAFGMQAGPVLGEQHASNLQQIASLTSPEVLEEATAVALQALESLKPPLDAVSSLITTQAAQWLKAIDDLKSRAKPTRTIVGVMGNTGAGKSSVISAVLDEERSVMPCRSFAKRCYSLMVQSIADKLHESMHSLSNRDILQLLG